MTHVLGAFVLRAIQFLAIPQGKKKDCRAVSCIRVSLRRTSISEVTFPVNT